MKKIALLPLLMLAVAGCAHGQIPPNPTTYSCPATTGSTYVALNQSTPATGLTYTDTNPAAGTYCYIAQSVIPATNNSSAPSNTAGPLTTAGTNSVDLTWTAPTTGAAPTGYVLSRAAAIATTVNAPVLGTGSIVAKASAPEILQKNELTATSSLVLTAKLSR